MIVFGMVGAEGARVSEGASSGGFGNAHRLCYECWMGRRGAFGFGFVRRTVGRER